jgi:hypothetical protein
MRVESFVSQSAQGHESFEADACLWIRSASFPTEVKDVVTLLVKSKTCRKGTLYTTLEGQRDQGYASSDANSNEVGA